MHLYNFKELQGLEPSKLLKLHLPAAPLPSPMLMIEQELSLTLRGLLLGFAGDVQPPALPMTNAARAAALLSRAFV